ncbi:MAG TPA: hypothetical protein VFN64_03685 [Burkholderiaceae bacterium]|nr:hypothetical protein [Burkholderiaceae bacterium]
MAPPAVTAPQPQRDAAWHHAARRARQLSWASLAWMCVEGVVGLRECADLWRGEGDDCCAPVGFGEPGDACDCCQLLEVGRA